MGATKTKNVDKYKAAKFITWDRIEQIYKIMEMCTYLDIKAPKRLYEELGMLTNTPTNSNIYQNVVKGIK